MSHRRQCLRRVMVPTHMHDTLPSPWPSVPTLARPLCSIHATPPFPTFETQVTTGLWRGRIQPVRMGKGSKQGLEQQTCP